MPSADWQDHAVAGRQRERAVAGIRKLCPGLTAEEEARCRAFLTDGNYLAIRNWAFVASDVAWLAELGA